MAQFWWENNKKEKKIHWRKWAKLGEPTSSGGLGFCDIEAFNKALLTKQIWRFLMYPTALVSQVMKSKYFKKGNVLEAQILRQQSYLWRSIFSSIVLVKEGLCWRVGDGHITKM